MSISQIKKQFEDMAAYLGRDVAGLEKLRKLKDAVNVLRTKFAAAEGDQKTAVAIRDSAVAESLKADKELAAMRLTNHGLTQRIASLSNELEAIKASILSETPEEPETEGTNNQHFGAAMRELRRHLKRCPPLASERGDTIGIKRSSFAKGWTRQDMWVLGVSVAALSAMTGEVLVLSDEKLLDVAPNEKDRVQFLKWFAGNIAPVVTTEFDEVCAGMIEIPAYYRATGFRG